MPAEWPRRAIFPLEEMDAMKIEGSGIVVTGGSRGLGAALGLELGKRGARVALVARGASALDGVVGRVRAAGGRAHALPADVGDKADTHRIAGAAAALLGEVDAVVHGASLLGALPLAPLVDTTCEDLGRVLEANLVGPFRLTRALVGPMLLRGHGLVVHVSSDAAVSAYPRWGAYGMSKAALDHLMRTWAAELDGTGIRFLGVDPGEMDTQMHADAMPGADRATLARPEDVARAIVEMIEDPSLATGARIEASAWRRAR